MLTRSRGVLMSSVERFHSNFAMYRFVWRLLDRAERRRLILLQVLTLAMGVSTLISVAAVMPFFSALANPAALDAWPALRALQSLSGLGDPRDFLVLLGCAFVAVVMIANIMNLAGMLTINRFALRIGREFHVALFAEYLHRDYLFHARGGSVTLLNNVIFETTRVATGIIQGGLTFVASAFTCVLIVVVVLLVNPPIALCAAALIGSAYALVYALAQRRLARYGREEAALWDARIRILTESFGAIREILLRGNQDFFRDSFATRCDAMTRVAGRNFTLTHAPRYLFDALTVAGLVGAALLLIRGASAAHWLAQLGFLALAAYRLLPAVQSVYATVARMRADRASFERIAGDLLRARADEARHAPVKTGLAEWYGRPRLQLVASGLSFRYSAEAPLAVRNATLSIRAGTCVGFVGPNGSGKTTMADLLLGLLAPEAGEVVVDGVPLDASNRSLWQSTAAYVPQNIYLLDDTIAANVAFGVPAEQMDAARLTQVLATTRLAEFVATLPGGVNHVLGERGMRLSGGWRQRVGIARALYRGASLLVLDEATSALDGLAEQEAVAAVDELRGRTTVIVVAHRLSSVRNCDVIYEFEAGAVVGSGSHEQLWRDSSRFRRLAGLQ